MLLIYRLAKVDSAGRVNLPTVTVSRMVNL